MPGSEPIVEKLRYSIVNDTMLLPLSANPNLHNLNELKGLIATELQYQKPRAIIIDAGEAQFMSVDEYRAVRGVMDTCRISGVRAFMVGIQAAVATTLALSDDALNVSDVMLDIATAMKAIESDYGSAIDPHNSK